jgi:hypothetical protein
VTLLSLLGLVCDKSYNPAAGPLHLPMAMPPTHVLKIGGIQSVFPILWQLDLSRPANEPAAAIVFFVTQEMPSAEQLLRLRPMPLDSLRAAGFKISPIGEVDGYGRFAGYAQWAEGQTEAECTVPDIPVFAEGWLLYPVANPLPAWVEVTLHFNRINVPDPPEVTVLPLSSSDQP